MNLKNLNSMPNTNKGNVLFLILIAVALFAALSYAVTQSSRTSGDGISKDKVKIIAAQITQYATAMEQAVNRIMIINNEPEYKLDFSAAGISNSTANTTCTTNECRIFHVDGGSISAQILPMKAWDMDNTIMTGSYQGKMWNTRSKSPEYWL